MGRCCHAGHARKTLKAIYALREEGIKLYQGKNVNLENVRSSRLCRATPRRTLLAARQDYPDPFFVPNRNKQRINGNNAEAEMGVHALVAATPHVPEGKAKRGGFRG